MSGAATRVRSLLWMLMLSWWTAAVVLSPRQLPETMVAAFSVPWAWWPWASLLFILLTSNPFGRLLPGAEEGRDLNPLLPRILASSSIRRCSTWVTWVFGGFSLLPSPPCSPVQLDAAWALVPSLDHRRLDFPHPGASPWGSWWAYYELGWGGWWFWDRWKRLFMPWLVGTALVLAWR